MTRPDSPDERSAVTHLGGSRLSSLGSGAVTGLALAVQTGLAAVVGVIVAREFGRTAETDGFFAAYAVYVVVLLAANAIRVVVLPPLARAHAGRRLGSEVAAYVTTLALIAIPLLVVAVAASSPLSWLLTGNGPDEARATAADALPWIVLAGMLQLFAGLAASTLAALDDYLVAAAGYVLGSACALGLILLRIEDDGIQAVSWGMALQGAVALLVPSVALALRARAERMPATAIRPPGLSFGSRLGELGTGVSVALALQAIYLVCVPLAAREGVGALTSFSYAYLIASAVVAITASSLGLVTAVPLARLGIDPGSTARHIVSSSWIAIVAIGATAGVFGLAGAEIARRVFGSVYGDDVGGELGRLVVALAPWAAVSVGISIAFPLVFVARRSGRLPLLALAALLLHLPLALLGQAVLGLAGLALALAATTGVLLAGLLALLHAAARTARGLGIAVLVTAILTGAAFAPAGLLLGRTLPAAAVGALLYALLLGALRPRPLAEAWRYLRALA